MRTPDALQHGRRSSVAAFVADRRASSAVEFSIICMPFILVLLVILQLGIFYMAQSSLDAGVIKTADSLVNTFYTGATPSIPTASALKTLVATNSGGMVHNDSTLSVELRKLSALTAAPVAISNTVDTSAPGDVLALRAQASVPTFVPGFASLAVVRSSALVRRQGL